MTNKKQALGRWGENQAASYLQRNGYTILNQNIRTPYGEIDILAAKEEVLVFAEVKTRSSRAFGLPEQAITPNKREHLIRSALAYLQNHSNPNVDWRIDVIAVQKLPTDVEILHFENAITG